MSNLQVKWNRSPGLTTMIPRGETMKTLQLQALHVLAGQEFRGNTEADEAVIVPIRAQAFVKASEVEVAVHRKSVFTDPAQAVYFPPGTDYSVKASSDSLFAICRAQVDPSSQGRLSPFFVDPSTHAIRSVGHDMYQRKVVTILDHRHECASIILGETYNPPGHWSSFPPHKHDRHVTGLETDMEEIYFFQTDPEFGFGFQRVYTEDGLMDQAITLGNDTAVAIPKGYHPVAAMPGVQLYYLWFLAGRAGSKRELMPFTDPRFKWLEKPASSIKE